MKAPERIYIHPMLVDNIYGMCERSCDSEIEYVREDIVNSMLEMAIHPTKSEIKRDLFIEKALAYLNDKFCFNNAFYGIVSCDFNSMEEMYKDFKNYMKGE